MSTARARRTARWSALAVAALLLGASCSSEGSVGADAPPPAAADERAVFVALGGDETLARGVDDSFRQAWPRQVFAALPRSAVYVNLATEDATTESGLAIQLDAALALEPTVATVWFGEGDAEAGTDLGAFAAELTTLTTQLRDAGARVLLLADPGDEDIAAFLPIVEAVASENGVTYVAVPGGRGDPSDPAAQDAVAEAVTAALDG